MIILTNLTATKSDGKPIADQRCITSAVHVELAPGCFIHVLLSHEGLVIGLGESKVLIPLYELTNLAQTHEPSMVPPKPTPSLTVVSAHDDKFNGK